MEIELCYDMVNVLNLSFSYRCFYRSDNLEGLGARAICFVDAEIVGDWYVHTEDNIWVTDDSLTIQCDDGSDQ